MVNFKRVRHYQRSKDKYKDLEIICPWCIKSVFNCENPKTLEKYPAMTDVIEVLKPGKGKFNDLSDNYEAVFYYDTEEDALMDFNKLKIYKKDGLFIELNGSSLYLEWKDFCPNGIIVRVV